MQMCVCYKWTLKTSLWANANHGISLLLSEFHFSFPVFSASPFTHTVPHTYPPTHTQWGEEDEIIETEGLYWSTGLTYCTGQLQLLRVCVCSCSCSLKLCSDHPSLPSSSLVLSGKGSETCTSWRTLLWHNYIFFSTKKWRDVIGQLDCSVEVCLCMFSSLMKEMKSCATMAPAVTFSVWGYCPCCQGNQLLW